MVLHGLFGPPLSPKNLATVLSWVHFRGALTLALLFARQLLLHGMPVYAAAQRDAPLHSSSLHWPRRLRNKWIPTALFALILFFYELFSLWSSPWLTAWVIVGYFAAILLIDGLFKHATFCKFICPIGQFNFVASTVSPLEVEVREQNVCSTATPRTAFADGMSLIPIS